MSHEPMTAGAVQKKSKIYGLSMTAVMAAVTCVLAPMSIPIGPVPISFTNLAIYLSLYLLGWKRGTVSYLVYVLIGMVGVPVFSGFTGGMATKLTAAKIATLSGTDMIIANGRDVCILHHIFDDSFKGTIFQAKKKESFRIEDFILETIG